MCRHVVSGCCAITFQWTVDMAQYISCSILQSFVLIQVPRDAVQRIDRQTEIVADGSRQS